MNLINHIINLIIFNLTLFQMPQRSVLITGSSGLLGRAVFDTFTNHGWKVAGLAYSRARDPLIKVDLSNFTALIRVITDVKVCAKTFLKLFSFFNVDCDCFLNFPIAGYHCTLCCREEA